MSKLFSAIFGKRAQKDKIGKMLQELKQQDLGKFKVIQPQKETLQTYVKQYADKLKSTYQQINKNVQIPLLLSSNMAPQIIIQLYHVQMYLSTLLLYGFSVSTFPMESMDFLSILPIIYQILDCLSQSPKLTAQLVDKVSQIDKRLNLKLSKIFLWDANGDMNIFKKDISDQYIDLISFLKQGSRVLCDLNLDTNYATVRQTAVCFRHILQRIFFIGIKCLNQYSSLMFVKVLNKKYDGLQMYGIYVLQQWASFILLHVYLLSRYELTIIKTQSPITHLKMQNIYQVINGSVVMGYIQQKHFNTVKTCLTMTPQYTQFIPSLITIPYEYRLKQGNYIQDFQDMFVLKNIQSYQRVVINNFKKSQRIEEQMGLNLLDKFKKSQLSVQQTDESFNRAYQTSLKFAKLIGMIIPQQLDLQTGTLTFSKSKQAIFNQFRSLAPVSQRLSFMPVVESNSIIYLSDKLPKFKTMQAAFYFYFVGYEKANLQAKPVSLSECIEPDMSSEFTIISLETMPIQFINTNQTTSALAKDINVIQDMPNTHTLYQYFVKNYKRILEMYEQQNQQNLKNKNGFGAKQSKGLMQILIRQYAKQFKIPLNAIEQSFQKYWTNIYNPKPGQTYDRKIQMGKLWRSIIQSDMQPNNSELKNLNSRLEDKQRQIEFLAEQYKLVSLERQAEDNQNQNEKSMSILKKLDLILKQGLEQSSKLLMKASNATYDQENKDTLRIKRANEAIQISKQAQKRLQSLQKQNSRLVQINEQIKGELKQYQKMQQQDIQKQVEKTKQFLDTQKRLKQIAQVYQPAAQKMQGFRDVVAQLLNINENPVASLQKLFQFIGRIDPNHKQIQKMTQNLKSRKKAFSTEQKNLELSTSFVKNILQQISKTGIVKEIGILKTRKDLNYKLIKRYKGNNPAEVNNLNFQNMVIDQWLDQVEQSYRRFINISISQAERTHIDLKGNEDHRLQLIKIFQQGQLNVSVDKFKGYLDEFIAKCKKQVKEWNEYEIKGVSDKNILDQIYKQADMTITQSRTGVKDYGTALQNFMKKQYVTATQAKKQHQAATQSMKFIECILKNQYDGFSELWRYSQIFKQVTNVLNLIAKKIGKNQTSKIFDKMRDTFDQFIFKEGHLIAQCKFNSFDVQTTKLFNEMLAKLQDQYMKDELKDRFAKIRGMTVDEIKKTIKQRDWA